MVNLATKYPGCTDERLTEIDQYCAAELMTAGIPYESFDCFRSGEVPTKHVGLLHGWSFKRAWYYWVAKGPGIPPVYANELHATHGKEVRVDGHCGAPSPLEWFKGFAVGHYHVDTQEGLNALAATIKKITSDALTI